MTVSYEDATTYIRSLGFQGKVASNIVLVQNALQRNIKVARSSNGRAITLTDGQRNHWWRGGNSSLNTRLAKRVSQYKSVTNALLQSQGIKTTNTFLFEADDVEVAWLWAQKFDSVVVKPDDGQGGSDVFLDISDRDEFAEKFNFIAEKYEHGVLVEPFFPGNQVRCLVVNNKVVAATLMRQASVLGDGKSNLTKLVKAKNKERASHESHEAIDFSPGVITFLDKQGLNPRSVPKRGERVFLSNVSNLQRGGDSVDITGTLSETQIDFVQKVARAIPGMRLAGVDVIFDINGNADESVVLEVNTSPQLSIHHFPWEGEPQNVAGHVLDAMFPAARKTDALG